MRAVLALQGRLADSARCVATDGLSRRVVSQGLWLLAGTGLGTPQARLLAIPAESAQARHKQLGLILLGPHHPPALQSL